MKATHITSHQVDKSFTQLMKDQETKGKSRSKSNTSKFDWLDLNKWFCEFLLLGHFSYCESFSSSGQISPIVEQNPRDQANEKEAPLAPRLILVKRSEKKQLTNKTRIRQQAISVVFPQTAGDGARFWLTVADEVCQPRPGKQGRQKKWEVQIFPTLILDIESEPTRALLSHLWAMVR